MSTLTVKELSHPAGEVIKIAAGKTLDLKSQGSVTMPTGSVLQVVHMDTIVTYSSSTGTWTNTNSLLSITPTSTSSKIIGFISGFALRNSGNAAETQYRIAKDGTEIMGGSSGIHSFGQSSTEAVFAPVTIHFSDIPNTTNPITYSLQARSNAAGTVLAYWYRKQFVTLMEIQG